MNIALITGSCGLVGSESSIFFSNKGFKILGIDNNARIVFGRDRDPFGFGWSDATPFQRRGLNPI